MELNMRIDKSQFKEVNFTPTELEAAVGSSITFDAIVQNFRHTKWGGFLTLRKFGKGIQVVVDGETTIFKNDKSASVGDILDECSLRITGFVRSATIKSTLIHFKTIEIAAASIKILTTPVEHLPLDVNKSGDDPLYSLATKLDWRHVSLRNLKDIAIFKISSQVVRLYQDFLDKHNFTQIFSPKIVSSGAEGGANIFEIDYFDRKCYLAQSPQFYKQMSVAYFERVYEIGPVFRAEKHATSRHLNEYVSLDLEMAFIKDHTDIMALKISLLQYIINGLSESCHVELGILGAQLPQLPDAVPTFTVAEIHDIVLKEYGVDNRIDPDLSNEDEMLIGQYVLKNFGSDFLFATHYPTKARAFYSFNDPSDSTYTLTFDMIFRGRELTSGGQRMHDHKAFLEKIESLGLSPSSFKEYLDIFKYGMPPHGGFGMGLERLTSALLGIQNIKEASLFPRDINRVTP